MKMDLYTLQNVVLYRVFSTTLKGAGFELVYPTSTILYQLLWNLTSEIHKPICNKSTTPHYINRSC